MVKTSKHHQAEKITNNDTWASGEANVHCLFESNGEIHLHHRCFRSNSSPNWLWRVFETARDDIFAVLGVYFTIFLLLSKILNYDFLLCWTNCWGKLVTVERSPHKGSAKLSRSFSEALIRVQWIFRKVQWSSNRGSAKPSQGFSEDLIGVPRSPHNCIVKPSKRDWEALSKVSQKLSQRLKIYNTWQWLRGT